MRRALLPVLAVLCLLVAVAPARAATPNDPKFSKQWGLIEIDAPQAWDISTGAGVSVAVVDTGVRADHEDLVGHMLPGWGFDGTTNDTYGHGTEVAGVIAATKDNLKGIAGVAPDASIVPIRAFSGTEDVSTDRIVDALDHAAASGARVVNASLSTDPLDPTARDTRATRQAIDAVLARYPSTLFVTAAGNGGNDDDAFPVYPCSATAANLICVGSYDETGQPSTSSNYGHTSVDLFAPGVNIWTTWIASTQSYRTDDGTSLAAPFVAGEAALLLSEVPGLTPAETIGVILDTSRRDAAFSSKSAAGGSPNADVALQAATVDSDRDGVYDVIDACPTQAYATADGCAPQSAQPTPTPQATPTPTPAPAPRLRSLKAKVSHCRAGHRCRRTATVTFTLDRTASVSLRVERHVCAHGRCRWSAVLVRVLSAGTRGATVTVRGNRRTGLAKGGYRVTAVASSSAGKSTPATKTFRVR